MSVYNIYDEHDLDNEIWKDAVGYEGFYRVSNWGRVKSVSRSVNCKGGRAIKKGKIIKQTLNPNGYPTVSFSVFGKTNSVLVHRLVAKAFIQNNENKPFINHKNRNRTDGNVSNLEWCTQKENVQYSYDNGVVSHMKGKRNELNGRSKPVKCVETGIVYPSAAEAGRKLNICASDIQAVCLGRRPYAHRLTFKHHSNGVAL